MKFERTNTKISLLEDFYSHSHEDERLKTRHGQVEFITNITYLLKEINKNDKIIDVGAGTGAYSIYLHDKGYDVTAVELVEYNLNILRSKNKDIKSYQGDVRDLSIFKDNTFDVVILFGPMYHLLNDEDRIKALKEVKRIIKDNGKIFISYYMNDYAVITYGFIKKNIMDSIKEGRIDDKYHIVVKDDDIFSFVTLEDINRYNSMLGFERINIIASDGASDYLRVVLNSLSEEEFNEFIKYHLKNAERSDLLGASSHLMDIVKVKKE